MKAPDQLDDILRKLLPKTYNSAPKRYARAVFLFRLARWADGSPYYSTDGDIESALQTVRHSTDQLPEFITRIRYTSDIARRNAHKVAGQARATIGNRQSGRFSKIVH